MSIVSYELTLCLYSVSEDLPIQTLSFYIYDRKMGPDWDTEAVVDPRLRVYGVKGLRVIDASISK